MNVETKLKELTPALRGAGAKFAYLFGSRAWGTPGPDSDIDLAAHFGHKEVRPWEIPGVDFETVDLIVLDTCSLELAGRAATRGVLLFDDDPPARVRWEATTRKLFFDEQPRLEQAWRDFVQGIHARVHGRS